MDDRRQGSIVAAVTLTLAVAFGIITHLFMRTELDTTITHAEQTTTLLTDALTFELERTEDMQGSLNETLSSFGYDRNVNAFIFDKDDHVLASTQDRLIRASEVPQILPARVWQVAEELADEREGTEFVWTGLSGLMPQGQVLYVIRYSEGLDAVVLVANTAEQSFSAMREQVTRTVLGLVVIMVLLLLLVMFIVRWYRARLIQVATTDELTGLQNRKAFASSYEHAQREGRLHQASLALIDVDKFKQINDTYGHAAGDEALASVARELCALAGDDGLAGRWGGDEFICCVMGEEALVHERINQTISAISELKLASGAHVSISVGAATVRTDLVLEEMVERCDDALYVTKESGRGFLTVFEPGVTPHMSFDANDKAASKKLKERTSAPAETDSRRATHDKGHLPRNAGARHYAEVAIKSLLVAVQKMVPFVAAGGILIAIAFVVDATSVDLASLTPQERAAFGSITPLAAGLKDVGSAAFNFMLPIFAAFFAAGMGGEEAFMAGFAGGYLASLSSAGFLGAILAAITSAVVCNLMRGIIQESKRTIQRVAPVLIYPLFSLTIMYLLLRLVLEPVATLFETNFTDMLLALQQTGNDTALGAVLGAMMSIDMGGPINKCAYHFGLAAIEAQHPEVMAAVMVAGMVPPTGIACALALFHRSWRLDELERGPATLIMGLSFVTEGAIPFVIEDPLRTLSACILGSATAGALSCAFGCTSMAPHGGIFVFPVVGSPLAYLTALVAGSMVTGITLGLLKRKRGA